MERRIMKAQYCVFWLCVILTSASMPATLDHSEKELPEELRKDTQADEYGHCSGMDMCITEINLQCAPRVLYTYYPNSGCYGFRYYNYSGGNFQGLHFAEEFPWGPWVELHNPTNEAINISNYYFQFNLDESDREGNASIPICNEDSIVNDSEWSGDDFYCDSDSRNGAGPWTLMDNPLNQSPDYDPFIVQPGSYAVIRVLYVCHSLDCNPDFRGSTLYPLNENPGWRRFLDLKNPSGSTIQTLIIDETWNIEAELYCTGSENNPGGPATLAEGCSGWYGGQFSNTSLYFNHNCGINSISGHCFESPGPITPWGVQYVWNWHYPENYLEISNMNDVGDPIIPCPECGSWGTDSDGDWVGDQIDNCPSFENPNQSDLDLDGIGDPCDDDTDGDGVENQLDAFPLNESESSDSDGDGVGDNWDVCSGYDDSIDADLDGTPDGCDSFVDTDDDDDGVFSEYDLCPDTGLNYVVDSDGCSPNQLDSDGDGVMNDQDICLGDDRVDEDSDGIPDDCDEIIDTDRDGVSDSTDKCPSSNDLIDVDEDGIPDGCDPLVDSDGDGIADDSDACPGDDDSIDIDSDGIPYGCDELIDTDGDGVPDLEYSGRTEGLGWDRCEGHDDNLDDDRDGIPNGCDSFQLSVRTERLMQQHFIASIAVLAAFAFVFSRMLDK